jgi:hypothetical protein
VLEQRERKEVGIFWSYTACLAGGKTSLVIFVVRQFYTLTLLELKSWRIGGGGGGGGGW